MKHYRSIKILFCPPRAGSIMLLEVDKKLGNIRILFTEILLSLPGPLPFTFLLTGKRPDKHAEYFSSEARKYFLSTNKFDQSAPLGGQTYTAQLHEAYGCSYLGVKKVH